MISIHSKGRKTSWSTSFESSDLFGALFQAKLFIWGLNAFSLQEKKGTRSIFQSKKKKIMGRQINYPI